MDDLNRVSEGLAWHFFRTSLTSPLPLCNLTLVAQTYRTLSKAGSSGSLNSKENIVQGAE